MPALLFLEFKLKTRACDWRFHACILLKTTLTASTERAGILMLTFMLDTLMSNHDCIRYKKHPIYVHKLAFLDAETDLIAGTLENTGNATQDEI